MATRQVTAGGGNWSSTSTWEDATVPLAGDDVLFVDGSGNVTLTADVLAAGAGLKSLTFNSGYVGTLAMAGYDIYVGNNLGGTESITFASGMTVTGTAGSALMCMYSLTITWNGFTWPRELRFRGTSQTYTMADAGAVSGTLCCNGATTVTLNGSSLNASGGLSQEGGDFQGNTALTLSGGTWAKPGGGVQIISMTIAGNVTISNTAGPQFKTGTLTYASGTVTTTGSTLTILDSCTLDTDGITWNTIALSANPTITLNSTLTAAMISVAATSNPTFTGTDGFNIGSLYGATVVSGVRTVTLKYDPTVTYVATGITMSGTNDTTTYREIKSSSTNEAEKAILNVTDGANLTFVRGTRINSSGGDPVYTTGTITQCLNWSAPPSTGTVSAVFNVTP